MKLYIANGTYVGTQADAKAITKQFTEVDVPTDKAGLIAYLNGLEHAVFTDHFETVVERNDPPVAAQPSYADISVGLDEAFSAAPLAHRLTLAQLALEDAIRICPTLATPDRPVVWEENKADDDENVAEPDEDPFA